MNIGTVLNISCIPLVSKCAAFTLKATCRCVWFVLLLFADVLVRRSTSHALVHIQSDHMKNKMYTLFRQYLHLKNKFTCVTIYICLTRSRKIGNIHKLAFLIIQLEQLHMDYTFYIADSLL